MKPETNGPTKNETLFGGIDLEVELLDGTKQTVRVKQLPISQIKPLAVAYENDECAEIALFTGKPKEFADTLTIKSAEKIIAEGERINADPLERWFQRQMRKLERFNPELAARLGASATSPTT